MFPFAFWKLLSHSCICSKQVYLYHFINVEMSSVHKYSWMNYTLQFRIKFRGLFRSQTRCIRGKKKEKNCLCTLTIYYLIKQYINNERQIETNKVNGLVLCGYSFAILQEHFFHIFFLLKLMWLRKSMPSETHLTFLWWASCGSPLFSGASDEARGTCTDP